MMAGEEGFVTPLAGASRACGSLGEAVGEIPSPAFHLSIRIVSVVLSKMDALSVREA